jgi:predicted RNA-binding protein YlqC (UPF0109 family)
VSAAGFSGFVNATPNRRPVQSTIVLFSASGHREINMIIASNGAAIVAPTMDVVKPPATVDSKDAAANKYWAYRLSVSPQDLSAAIEKVGPSVAAIRRHLGK